MKNIMAFGFCLICMSCLTEPKKNKVEEPSINNTLNKSPQITDEKELREFNKDYIFTNLFDNAGGKLSPEVIDEIIIANQILSKYPNTSIEISSYTDNIGAAKANQLLSQERADFIATMFIKLGLEKNRIKAIGYGKSPKRKTFYRLVNN